MENFSEGGKTEKPANKGLMYVILAGSLLIALGLAFGLGFGLRSLKRDLDIVEEMTTPTPEDGTTPKPSPTSKSGTYRFAGVATDSQECSTVGTETLARGGSAVDAAIAVAVCNNVVTPNNCGIGGGFFMTIFDRPSGTVTALDARERAPLAANETLFVGRNAMASRVGGLAIAVPGELMGYWEAHQRYGKLPWRDLFQPSIKLCRDGVKIGSFLAYAISETVDLLRSQNVSRYFDPQNKDPLKEGDTVKFPRFAATLETIANEGASAFYNGSLTDTIVQEIQENGGIITREDLTGYTAKWRTPTNFTLRNGHTVYSVPPPGSGPVLEYMLNILDGYGFTKDSISSNEKIILTYHRIVEAMKFAFAKRTLLGDQDFEDVSEVVRNMTSPEFGDSIRQSIDDSKTQDTEYYDPSFFKGPDQGTSHISIVDAQGNAVAMTTTINFHFGAVVEGNSTGILYNNEMDDFSTPGIVNLFGLSASPINFIKPGKRPLSSMCPAIVVNNSTDVVLVVGGSGGSRITTGALLVAVNALNFERSPRASVDYRRLHHQLLPPTLQVEDGFPKVIEDGLRAKGHNTTVLTIPSNINIVQVKDGVRYAVSDFRKAGSPDGY